MNKQELTKDELVDQLISVRQLKDKWKEHREFLQKIYGPDDNPVTKTIWEFVNELDNILDPHSF